MKLSTTQDWSPSPRMPPPLRYHVKHCLMPPLSQQWTPSQHHCVRRHARPRAFELAVIIAFEQISGRLGWTVFLVSFRNHVADDFAPWENYPHFYFSFVSFLSFWVLNPNTSHAMSSMRVRRWCMVCSACVGVCAMYWSKAIPERYVPRLQLRFSLHVKPPTPDSAHFHTPPPPNSSPRF